MTQTGEHVSEDLSYQNPGPGKSVRDFHLEDTHPPVTDVLMERSLPREVLRNDPISPESYISPEYAREEFDKLWMHVWQMACRENAIPNPGDFCEYEICDQSVLVVRANDGAIRAYHNVCLHRGTPLLNGIGNAKQLKCNFHGWTWNLDGTLKNLPCRWDFPDLTDDQLRLPELKVDTWSGFVFVNFDQDAGPLQDFIGETLIRHFDYWGMDKRPIVGHVSRICKTNWKIIIEQFVETYHATTTHPQLMAFHPGSRSQYDVYEGKHSRFIALFGTCDPALGYELSDDEILEAMLEESLAGSTGSEVTVAELKAAGGGSARAILAQLIRNSMLEKTGRDLSEVSDSEVLDPVQYSIFPNLVPFTSTSASVCYRARPNGFDPDTCILEVMVFGPKVDGELPPDVEVDVIDPEEQFQTRPVLGGLAFIFDQDMVNMVRLQRGLKSRGLKQIQLAQYQEACIRAYHDTLDEFMNRD